MLPLWMPPLRPHMLRMRGVPVAVGLAAHLLTAVVVVEVVVVVVVVVGLLLARAHWRIGT